jgi:hypothetical protein
MLRAYWFIIIAHALSVVSHKVPKAGYKGK